MRNLFVCHTQYNLVLAAGLALTDFQNDESDLILYKDFVLNDKLKKEILNVFNKTLFISHLPITLNSSKEKMERIDIDIHEAKLWLDQRYDRTFIVEDMCIQEMFIMKAVQKLNKHTKLIWLEDGANAYFNTTVSSGGMGQGLIKRTVRKIVFSLRYRLFGYYDLASCMGAHKKLSEAYLTFPEYVRKELADKKITLIEQQSLEKGMEILYPGEIFDADKGSVMIALDKLDRYGNDLETVTKMVEKIVIQCEKSGKTVYYKFHPRENQTLEPLKRCQELDKGIAAESYLIHCSHRNIKIIGIKSNTLQIALKLGYETVSYVKLMKKQEPDIYIFYDKIGIICPETLE